MRPLSLGLVVLLSTLSAAAQPTVSIQLNPPSSMDAEMRSTWTAVFTNLTNAPLEDVPYYISSQPSTIAVRPEGCGGNFAERVDCRIDLPAGGSREISFTTRNLVPTGHFGVVMAASLHGAMRYDEAVIGREFFVTTKADAGRGSLRQALTDINASCDASVPCIASFRIDEPSTEDGLYFITLHSPLPEITAPDVFIDGGAQIRRKGNSLNRPLIVLDGGAAGQANGLVFRGTYARATDLSVTQFRENGIETHASSSMLLRNFLVSNGSRGVVCVGGPAYVADNVLSGNGRSGGFFWTTSYIRVLRNIVDGNGASGLFFHKPVATKYDYSEAIDNVIRGNAHAGIGLSLMATGDFARNSFADNGGRPIDIGLDGPSTSGVRGYPGRGGVAGAPAIVAARFANGVTTLTVRPAPYLLDGAVSFIRLSIYAGSGDAQELIATVDARFSTDFTIDIARDLRGQLVRAAMVTNAIENFDDPMITTSEVGEGTVVF